MPPCYTTAQLSRRRDQSFMNDRTLALSILQKARDSLGERLTRRVIEAREEIEADAEGGSYLSEIETIYDQLGSRLAHINAMLSNLPSASSSMPADATASEIIYADLASAYPTGLDLEAAAPLTLLALPAPTNFDEQLLVPSSGPFASIVAHVQLGELSTASRLISELFDIRPSHARRSIAEFARQLVHRPELARRIADLDGVFESNHEHAAALLSECFEFHPLEALGIVRALVSPGDTGTDSH